MEKDNQGEVSQAMQCLSVALLAFATSGLPAVEPKPDLSKHTVFKHMLLVAVFAVLAVGAVWLTGNKYGVRYELQGSMVPAHHSDAALQELFREKAKSYQLQIIQPDGTQQAYPLEAMGMHVQADDTLAVARQKQRALGQRLAWWRPVEVKLIIASDPERLKEFIAQHATVAVESPRDATLALSEGTVQITDGAEGKRYGFTDPTHSILSAASNLAGTPLRMDVVAQQPEVTAEALASVKTRLEGILSQSVTFKIDDKQVMPERKQIADWIILAPDQQNKTVQISVNTSKVQAYVNKLASDHTRPPRAQVTLGTGGSIAGVPGLTITNKEVAVTAITEHVLEGNGLQVELPTKKTPFKTVTAASAGKWIEVDISTKRMYVYQQAEVVRTFLVSAGAPATPTVTGTFAIYSKRASQTMSGPNADGTRYVQPNVPWVNYFYKDYAIHGNYWRPASYFGNINSSHGCVGLRSADAAWVYSWAPVGTPVVIHG